MKNISTADSVSPMPSEDRSFYIEMVIAAFFSAVVVFLATSLL